MKKFYLLGNNTKSSLSPKIFQYIFKEKNMDATYQTVQILNNGVFKNYLHNETFDGLNITIPYKELAYQSINKFDQSVKGLELVNCIKREKSSLIGYNTDYYGFLMMLESQKIILHSKNILIVGTGAISKTVICAIGENYSCNLYICGRNNNKINDIVIKYRKYNLKKFNQSLEQNYVIINCTPANIDIVNAKNILSYLPVLQTDLFIDLNYIETELIKLIKKNKINVIMSIDMLIYQAIKSFNIWFNNAGKQINFNQIKQHLLNK